MKPLVAQAGDWIFESGEHGKDMYILVHGVVEFCRKGTIDPYSIAEAPNCFGETMAFGLVRLLLSSFAVIAGGFQPLFGGCCLRPSGAFITPVLPICHTINCTNPALPPAHSPACPLSRLTTLSSDHSLVCPLSRLPPATAQNTTQRCSARAATMCDLYSISHDQMRAAFSSTTFSSMKQFVNSAPDPFRPPRVKRQSLLGGLSNMPPAWGEYSDELMVMSKNFKFRPKVAVEAEAKETHEVDEVKEAKETKETKETEEAEGGAESKIEQSKTTVKMVKMIAASDVRAAGTPANSRTGGDGGMGGVGGIAGSVGSSMFIGGADTGDLTRNPAAAGNGIYDQNDVSNSECSPRRSQLLLEAAAARYTAEVRRIMIGDGEENGGNETGTVDLLAMSTLCRHLAGAGRVGSMTPVKATAAAEDTTGEVSSAPPASMPAVEPGGGEDEEEAAVATHPPDDVVNGGDDSDGSEEGGGGKLGSVVASVSGGGDADETC